PVGGAHLDQHLLIAGELHRQLAGGLPVLGAHLGPLAGAAADVEAVDGGVQAEGEPLPEAVREEAVPLIAGGAQRHQHAAGEAPVHHFFRSATAERTESAMMFSTSSSMPHHMGTLKELSHQDSSTGQSNSPAPSFWNRG